MGKENEIFGILPLKIRSLLEKNGTEIQNIQEIRLRSGLPIMIDCMEGEYFLTKDGFLTKKKEDLLKLSREEIRQTLEYISSYSLYAYEKEIRQGFLTIRGGHRIGLSGTAVMDGESVRTLKHISCLNIRVAHQIFGCAQKVYEKCQRNGKLLPTLLLSPPGCGKTTILRDLIRFVSNAGETVSVVDERSEIAASYQGVAQNDLGIRTDIIDGCKKDIAMNMMIRSMAPDVIAVDEIGSKEDVDALMFCAFRGCTLLATAHGKSRDALLKNPYMKEVVNQKMFQRYVLLECGKRPGIVKKILDENGVEIHD
ncbi:stage III sporulation protein AA [Anaerostipes sp. MSJ-23]|uniref:stage III sporulation protein AA n=1 Tax=Anaerostipes sp. MSJ-23 TaxID=2841520 RepID=UPI001C0FEB35|nr:stage III sporulation protein AA [Anaerostipes sp. MSJ-23]MBU5460964.1 stage III sporulation protein AA [Anaerostipes sp. MSJ-23]